MKTQAITQQIICNYRRLSRLAYVPSGEESVVPLWGITYKHNGTSGYVGQIGDIKRNLSSIRIVEGKELQLQKKPFYLTWKRALKNINTMLRNVINNLDNDKVVTKKVVNIQCFPKSAVERLSKIVRT